MVGVWYGYSVFKYDRQRIDRIMPYTSCYGLPDSRKFIVILCSLVLGAPKSVTILSPGTHRFARAVPIHRCCAPSMYDYAQPVAGALGSLQCEPFQVDMRDQVYNHRRATSDIHHYQRPRKGRRRRRSPVLAYLPARQRRGPSHSTRLSCTIYRAIVS